MISYPKHAELCRRAAQKRDDAGDKRGKKLLEALAEEYEAEAKSKKVRQ
jgi:predicted metal-binding protein